MPVRLRIAGLMLALAGCSAGSDPAANEAAAAPRPEKVPHCFFKDSETKAWSIDIDGDEVVVAGRAFRSDARYKAVLLAPKIDGAVAVLRPSISVNDTGFAAEGNWWDLTARIPAQGLERVEVRCGKALLAALPLPKPAG